MIDEQSIFKISSVGNWFYKSILMLMNSLLKHKNQMCHFDQILCYREIPRPFQNKIDIFFHMLYGTTVPIFTWSYAHHS